MQIVYNILCIIWNVMEADKEVQILKHYLGEILASYVRLKFPQPDLENI